MVPFAIYRCAKSANVKNQMVTKNRSSGSNVTLVLCGTTKGVLWSLGRQKSALQMMPSSGAVGLALL